jgi:hypothetical protein
LEFSFDGAHDDPDAARDRAVFKKVVENRLVGLIVLDARGDLFGTCRCQELGSTLRAKRQGKDDTLE